MRACLGLWLLAVACGGEAPPDAGARPPVAPAATKAEGGESKGGELVFPRSFQPTQRGSGSVGSVRMAWRDLLGAHCDLRQVHVWTPVEAKVLWNVPYAIAGQAFEAEELTALFEADGGWYHPSPTPARLRADELDCVSRLQAREQALRAEARAPLSPEAEERFTRDAGAFAAWWQWGTMAEVYPYSRETIMRKGEGGWTWMARVAGCRSARCGTYVIDCPGEGPCRWGAAG
jgi:hypothetical protein